jgi:hypothetical protein
VRPRHSYAPRAIFSARALAAQRRDAIIAGIGVSVGRATSTAASPTRSLPMITSRCFIASAALAALAWAVPSLAAAQPAPTFSYGKAEEVKDVKDVEWNASAEAGLIFTTGNSETTTITGSVKAARKTGANKLDFVASGAFARSTILIAADGSDGSVPDMMIGADEIEKQTKTTAESWAVKLRYDRFLTEFNSLYVAALASGDKPAGKEFVGGGQAGYSRQLYKTEKHEVVAEIGYDFSYEKPVTGDGVAIHSARAFTGYKGKLDDEVGVDASIEGLFNVNQLDTAAGKVDRFEDTRVNAQTSITAKLSSHVSFSFSLAAKYDHAPSPLPPFAGFTYEAGFQPLADTLDTITKASLIVQFL